MSSLIRRFKRPLIISSLLLSVALVILLALPGQAAESDAIAVRVLPNLEHDSIEVWYQKQGYQGSPQSLTVDGYEAIRDGRTVFVNAANVDLASKKIYTNVYLISYNQESEDKTQDILGQLISHWKFNSNLPQKGFCSIASLSCTKPDDCPSGFICANNQDQPNYGKCVLSEPTECLIDSDCPLNSYCDSFKAGLIRDISRLGKLSQIEGKLEIYKEREGAYPDLSSGSYLPGTTISVWPSWTDSFREPLGLNDLAVDPVNSLGTCPGFEAETCWNPQTKKFFDSSLILPAGSYAMIYRATPGGTSFNLCATFESPLLGYDTASTLLSAKNCASRGGYQGGVVNQPPYLVSSFLKGEANKEFNGYLKVRDPEGDLVSWRLTPASNFSTWSGVPILEATGDPSQKKVYASLAGDQGTYPMILNLADARGGVNAVPINLEIYDVFKISIEAENVNFNSFQGGSLQYSFFINSSDPNLDFNLSSTNSALNSGLSQAASQATITNITANRKQISLRIPLSQALSGEQIVRISASDTSGSDVETVVFNFIRDALTFNFSCANDARLNKPYQIDGSACLLGTLSQGVRTINYQVSANPFNFVIENSGGNAFLKSTAVKSGNTSLPNTPTTTLLKLTAIDSFGESVQKNLALRINTYCGDGIKQQPNTEGRGGPKNNGLEQCDGLDGLVPKGEISNSSSQQYACTTPPGASTPFPINSGEHCVFKAPQDGGGYCGDGFCQVSSGGVLRENCTNCPQDCGACECTRQCTGRICGPDACGGTCGTCASGETCNSLGLCEEDCSPNCSGRQCGSDNCGGTCGTCAFDEICNAGLCEKKICVPNCSGRECGPDGCGEDCGTCPSGEICNAGLCEKDDEIICIPNCSGRECGSDGCGGTCGTCVFGETCNASGVCEKTTCVPNCSGRQCGADGCGGACGTCASDETCNAGLCEKNVCVPNCSGRQCGADGCGGACGTCPNGSFCNASGLCEKNICIPNCGIRNCGDDGCGNANGCGTCPVGEDCQFGLCSKPICTIDCAGKANGADDGCGGTCCTPRCGINVCGDDGCGGTCGTCNGGETCIAGACCKLTATVNACGDRDTDVYFNGLFVDSTYKESPLMTNTVSLRPDKNYLQLKIFDGYLMFGDKFGLSAGINFSGCRVKSGKVPSYSVGTGSLSSWHCTGSNFNSWNTSNLTSRYYTNVVNFPAPIRSPRPNTNSSFCSGNNLYKQSSYQIWAADATTANKDKTSYCFHVFDLTEIVTSKKAAMPNYWCGDGTCNSGETNSNCPADCRQNTGTGPLPKLPGGPCGDCQPGKPCLPCLEIE